MKEEYLWVVLKEINDYNQYGKYFIAVFIKRPSLAKLLKLLPNEKKSKVGRLWGGGGRVNFEEEWYYLKRVKIGENMFD